MVLSPKIQKDLLRVGLRHASLSNITEHTFFLLNATKVFNFKVLKYSRKYEYYVGELLNAHNFLGSFTYLIWLRSCRKKLFFLLLIWDISHWLWLRIHLRTRAGGVPRIMGKEWSYRKPRFAWFAVASFLFHNSRYGSRVYSLILYRRVTNEEMLHRNISFSRSTFPQVSQFRTLFTLLLL